MVSPWDLSVPDHGGSLRARQVADVLSAHFQLEVLQARTPQVDSSQILEMPLSSPPLLATPNRSNYWRRPPVALTNLWVDIAGEVLEHVNSQRPPDIIYWCDSHVATAIGSVRRASPQIRHVVEFANIERSRYFDLARTSSGKVICGHVWEGIKAQWWERQVARDMDMGVLLCAADMARLPRSSTRVHLPNPIDWQESYRPSPSNARILTIGSWWYPPNSEGLTHFIDRHWPRIKAAVPQAEVHVVGQCPDSLRGRLASHDGVVVQGFVNDLSVHYESAAVVLAPARYGGGSQLKVSSALGHYRVVVGPQHLQREQRAGIPPEALTTIDHAHGDNLVRLLNDDGLRHRVEAGIRSAPSNKEAEELLCATMEKMLWA